MIALTDENGNVVERYAFDPWGARCNPDDWTQKDSRTSWIVNRGYTGHEHLDAFGIINMNGRVYDPLTAQFFSPDPVLTDAGNWLDYNRFSYCLNNPFRYTDPSGYTWWAENGKTIVETAAFIGTTVLFLVNPVATMIPYFLFFTEPGYELQKIISPVALHINAGIGSDQMFLGYEVSYGIPKFFPVSYRKHYGETYYWHYYDNSYQGKMTTKGAEWSLNGYMFGIPASVTYSGTTFSSGETSQTTNSVTLGNQFVNLKYENDWMFDIEMPGVPKGDGDRFRTAAVQLNIYPFSAGVNIFTGEQSDDNENNRHIDPITNKITYIENDGNNPDKYRLGLAYFGFGPIRAGVNSEHLRASIQNGVHSLTGDPYFLELNRPTTFYWYIGSTGGSTLWY